MMLDKNKVEKFINAAMEYLGDKYSQPKRMQKGYSDCSSIIQKALNNLGWNTRPNVTVTTHRMGIEGDSRFRQINMSELQTGDILWYRKDQNGKYFGHVGVYLGDNKVLEAIYEGVVIKPKSRIAWQRAYRVVALESAPTKQPVVTPKNLTGVAKANLNIRESNSTNSKVVGMLKKGQEIKITGQVGNWFKIDKGFISGAYVDLKSDVIQNVPILVNGKEIKKGYIVDGTTYITIGGKDKPVRNIFEGIGADVRWENNEVRISL